MQRALHSFGAILDREAIDDKLRSLYDLFDWHFHVIYHFNWLLRFSAKRIFFSTYQAGLRKGNSSFPSAPQCIYGATISQTLRSFADLWEVLQGLTVQHPTFLKVVPALTTISIEKCLQLSVSKVFLHSTAFCNPHIKITFYIFIEPLSNSVRPEACSI